MASMHDASPEFQTKEKEWTDSAREAFKKSAALLASPDLEGTGPIMEENTICGQDWQKETIAVAKEFL